MTILVKGDPAVLLSIVTTLRCREGHYSIPWIAPLYPWSLPNNAEYQARWHQVPYFETLVWIDLGLNFCLLDHLQTLYSLGLGKIAMALLFPDRVRDNISNVHRTEEKEVKNEFLNCHETPNEPHNEHANSLRKIINNCIPTRWSNWKFLLPVEFALPEITQLLRLLLQTSGHASDLTLSLNIIRQNN